MGETRTREEVVGCVVVVGKQRRKESQGNERKGQMGRRWKGEGRNEGGKIKCGEGGGRGSAGGKKTR
jgi:hypothetical protein